MLIAEPVHYVSAAADDIAYHSPPGGPRKLLEHIGREAVGKSRKRFFDVEARDLPVAGRAVFARGSGYHRSPGPQRITPPLHSFERPNVAETDPLQSRQFQSVERAGHVPQRVAAGIAVFGAVWRFANADSV